MPYNDPFEPLGEAPLDEDTEHLLDPQAELATLLDLDYQCEECHGSGIEGVLPDDTEVSCKWCGGSGKEA